MSLSEITQTSIHIKNAYTACKTPNDLYKLIEQIDLTTELLDHQLSHFVSLKLKKHQQDMNTVELSRATKLSLTIATSNQLTRVFGSAVDLGRSLTFKIKLLDEEIGNVNETLQFVLSVQSLKNNINRASYAMEHRNWEQAANCIFTIAQIDKEIIEGQFAAVVIPTADIPELPMVIVEKYTTELTEIFQKEFNAAAKARNVPELTNYFKLFPLINQEEVGLQCYSKFICSIISDTCQNLVGSVINKDNLKPGIFGTIIVQLFDNVAIMLSQHDPLIKQHYSYEGALPLVISRIQLEIDSQVGIIMDTFYDSRRIAKLFQDIGLYKFPHLSQTHQNQDEFELLDDEVISIVQVGDLINELATILNHWSFYGKFISQRYFKSDPMTLPALITQSKISLQVQSKFLPTFETLYVFYFRRSIEKAIFIEEMPNIEPYLTPNSNTFSEVACSSVIEDTTLILNSTLMNVINTGIPTTVKLFVSEASKILQHDLIGFFVKNLNESQPRYNQVLSLKGTSRAGTPEVTNNPGRIFSGTTTNTGGIFSGASSAFGNVVGAGNSFNADVSTNPTTLINYIVYLNSVAIGQEYFSKIIDNITKVLPQSFPFGKDSDKIQVSLKDDFLAPFTSITNKIVNDGLINLYNQSFKNKVAILVQEFLPEAEENYIVRSLEGDISFKFSKAWQLLVLPYKQTSQKSVFDRLLRLLIINLINMLDKRMMHVFRRYKVNDLGAVQLERDISNLIAIVCEDNYILREKFVRVTQIVLLVGLDDEEYEESIQHVNQSSEEYLGINWVLTPLERNAVRGFRA